MDPIGLASEIADPRELERAVLGGLAREVGYDAAFFAAKGHVPTCVGVDARTLDGAITRGDHEAELSPIKQLALSRRGVAVDTDVLGEARVRRLGYHRAFAAKVNGRHSLLAFMTLRGRLLGGIMLGRTGATFSASDVARVEAILPAVSFARASYALAWEGAPLPAAPSSWLGKLGAAQTLEATGERDLLVRDHGRVREMVAQTSDGELVWSRASLAEPSRSGWFYVELLHLAAARARGRTSALFI